MNSGTYLLFQFLVRGVPKLLGKSKHRTVDLNTNWIRLLKDFGDHRGIFQVKKTKSFRGIYLRCGPLPVGVPNEGV